MRLLGVLLLLLICQLGTPTPIFNRDDASFQSKFRSAAFGETIRDWYKTIKDRIIQRWQDWFGTNNQTPNFSPQDILNIDKTIRNRMQDYTGFLLDLSNLSFDQKQDWGIRLGNWYIIRKVTGDLFSSDSDSDEWDIRPLIPELSPPTMVGTNWTPNTHGSGIPQATQFPPITSKTGFTTYRQETPETVTQVESLSTSTESTVPPTEFILTSTEEISTIESAVISTKPTIISTESIISSTEPITLSIESVVTSTERIAISTESTTILNEPTTISMEPTIPSTESIITNPIVTSTESVLTSITEPTTTTTELTLPVLNKRIEDNETTNKRTRKSQNRTASAEVIMF